MTSGEATEITFRRLLRSCQEIVAGDNKGRADLKNWSCSPVFHHYVETLQDQLDDLKSTSFAKQQPAQWANFQQQVLDLASQLEIADPLTFALPLKRSAPETTAKGSTTRPADQQHVTQNRPMPPEKLARRTERPSPHQSAAGVDSQTRQLLGTQDHLQEAMMDEMADMAASLKQNVLGIEGSVKTRGRLLEETETALERSAAGAKQSNQTAKAVRSRGARSFWTTLLWLLLVGMIFVGMYVFIKVTSMAGYKHVKAKPELSEL